MRSSDTHPSFAIVAVRVTASEASIIQDLLAQRGKDFEPLARKFAAAMTQCIFTRAMDRDYHNGLDERRKWLVRVPLDSNRKPGDFVNVSRRDSTTSSVKLGPMIRKGHRYAYHTTDRKRAEGEPKAERKYRYSEV